MITFPVVWFACLRQVFHFFMNTSTTTTKKTEIGEDEGLDGDQSNEKKMKITLWNMFIVLMKVIVVSLLSVIILQQLADLSAQWAQKTQERDNKIQRWKHDCGDPIKPPIDPDIIEICNQLKIVINASPFTRALSKVISSWNSCITMPCSELLTRMSTHLELKLLAACVIIVILHYMYRVYGYTKTGGSKLKDYLQVKHTMKQLEMMKRNQQFPPYQKNIATAYGVPTLVPYGTQNTAYVPTTTDV